MPAPRTSQRSLSRQLVVPLLSGFIALVVIITSLVFFEMGDGLQRSIQKQLNNTAETSAAQLETLFQYQALNTAAWSKLEVMDDIITDDVDGRISRSLIKLKNSYQVRGEAFVLSVDRRIVATSIDGYDYGDVAYTVPAEWVIPNRGEVVFGGKFLNPFNQSEAVFFAHQISASFDETEVLGFLVVTIPWEIVEGIVSAGEDKSLLIDRSGDVLVDELSVGESSIVKAPQDKVDGGEIIIEGTPYLVGASVINSVSGVPLHWRLLELQRRSDALRPVSDLGFNILVTALTLSVVVMVLVVWLTRRLVTPIQEMTSTVLDITRSHDLTKRVEVISDNETGILADSFNRMTEDLATTMSEKDSYADRLSSLNKSLEQKVLDRTQAYKAANEQLEATVEQLKQAQSQLIQSEKMASLGQLVAGIAHEINNPLGSINANIPVLLEYTQDIFAVLASLEQTPEFKSQLEDIDFDYIQSDTPKLLASIKNATVRMKDIVLSLRNFSRLDQAEEQEVLLEEALEITLSLLEHRLKTHITVERQYQLNKPVLCFPGLINQVFMNVIANAEQAIEGQGTITIETNTSEGWAIVAIRDSGVGMDEATLKKVFDPFFTTKPVGEGTGMGMSISYGIIEKHGGRIDVQSDLGIGTVFTIALPVDGKEK